MAEKIASLGEALRHAHSALLADLTQLEETARGAPDAPTILLAPLTATRGHLASHFRLEEKGGYMDAVRDREPRMQHAVSQLGIEHGQLMQSLNGLVTRASRAAGADETLCEDVLQWLDRIRNHEHRENELIQEAFNTDLGGED